MARARLSVSERLWLLHTAHTDGCTDNYNFIGELINNKKSANVIVLFSSSGSFGFYSTVVQAHTPSVYTPYPHKRSRA